MRKYYLIIFLFIFALFVLLGWYMYSVRVLTLDNFKEEAYRDINVISLLVSERISEIFARLKYTASLPDIIEFNNNGMRILNGLYNQVTPFIKAVSRVSSAMKLVYTFPDISAIGSDLSGQKHNQIISKDHLPIMSSPFTAVQGYRVVSLHYPVFSGKKYQGAVAVLLDFDKFSQKYFHNLRTKGVSRIWIVDRNGYIIYSHNKNDNGKNVYNVFNCFPGLLKFIENAERSGTGAGYFRYPGDKNNAHLYESYIAGFKNIKLTNYNSWLIINYASVNSILSSLKFNYLFIGTLLALATIFIMMSYFMERINLKYGERLKAELDRKTSALKDSENRLKAMFNGMAELVLLTSEDGEIEYANKSTSKALGFIPEGRKCYEVFAGRPDDCPGCRRRDILRHNYTDLQGIKFIDGREYIVHNYPIKNGDGTVSQLTIMQDITEKKYLEKERDLLYKAINSATEIVIIVNPKGIIRYVSPSFKIIAGYDVKSIQEERIRRIGTHFIPYDLYYNVIRSLRNSDRWTGEFTIRGAEGQIILFLAGVSRFKDSSNEVAGYIIILKDITRERRQEITLNRILENAPIIALFLDNDFNVISMNRGFTNITGWYSDKIIGRNIFNFLVEKDDDGYVKDLITTADGKMNKTQKNIKANGKPVYISWINLPINDLDGRRTGTFCIGIDVTREKELEEKYLQAQKMEAVGRLAGGIAHDFNNLLTAIMGNVELAKIAEENEEPLMEHLVEIQNVAKRSAALTKQLLSLSRQKIGQKYDFINCNTIIKNIEKMLTRIIREDISLVFNLTDHIPLVYADEIQIEQIILNLAVNASDALPTGGKINIETIYKSDSEMIKILVCDNGHGINEDILPHIFEPFFTTKESGKGTGLGLSTVYGIVKAYNGEISVESKLGRGTTFTVSLPAAVKQRGSFHKRDISEPSRLPKKGTGTILIAEDEASIRTMLGSILTKYGYNIITADSGHSAIEIVKKYGKDISLLITDIVMPGMNGRILAKKLKAIYPDLKVIFMSGYAEDIPDEMIGEIKGSIFIQKPYTLESIMRAIAVVLKK